MKSDFVSLVSHQLKTPEGVITGYIDYMLEGLAGELNKEQRKTLTEMRAVSQSNYRLITDLLNVSRIERGVISVEIEAVGLGQIIDQSLRDYREKIADKGLSLRVEGPGDKITVLADKEKTVQALSNLINNAIKFTKEGSIAIRTSSDSDNGYGVVEISDTGIGMAPDAIGRLFSKDRVLSTRTSPEEGTGLGLYIAKQFMALQHGDISVTSEVGKGTSFYIKVPLMEGAGHREATNARRTKGHRSDSRGQSSVPTNIP
jgi:signal transduction histidine kinase